jgi:hypothetical protein
MDRMAGAEIRFDGFQQINEEGLFRGNDDAGELFKIRKSARTTEKALYALQPFNPGDTLIRFKAQEYLTAPNRFSVQLAENKHIILDPDCLQYINHSCRPNVFFDLPKMGIVCLNPITIDEEITFFYPSTEWSLSQGFECMCGSPTCLGHIRGARYVSPQVLKQYKLSEFIERKHLTYNRREVFYPEPLL